MRLTTAILSVASAALLTCSSAQAADPVVGGYILLRPNEGQAKLKALADSAAAIPINRLYLSFARPGMVYVPNSNTLEHVGLNYGNSGDYGFADLKEKIQKLQSAGVEVFLSVGGWNYGCFPYAYTYYSVGGYGTNTPNYYKINAFGGTLDKCTEANMWCYTCEPKSENTVLADFDIFPEPQFSETWKQAQDYVTQHAGGDKPIYHPEIVPGQEYTDPKHNLKVKVPGNNYFLTQKRDPYQDLVYLGRDLNLTGIDIDYEEMWHADMFKTTVQDGSFLSHQTVCKYATIMKDVQINIQKLAPKLKLATAAAVTGGLPESSHWWGGNLKNIWYNVNKFFPEVYKAISSSGGVNVMSYDVSGDYDTHECPTDKSSCPLNKQVDYYMKSFHDNNMDANVGYEIGIPAYPAPDHAPQFQLPLTQAELSLILEKYGSKGGFFWELYKAAGASSNVDVTSAAQQICKAALGANTPRCSGVIPQPGDRPHVVPSPVVVKTSVAPVVKPTSAPVVKPTSAPVVKPSKTVSSSGPKPTGASKCSAPQWVAGKKYVRDDHVQYKGREFKVNYDTNGAVPTTGGGWQEVAICVAGGECAAVDAWDASETYSTGAKVLYQSYIYTAKWYSKGTAPDESAWTKGERCNAARRR
ncbi:hypothetical protein BGZ72_002418 [Mortierella alpina]|nr:hypothetical protein BGZ72_002418 [Mortierella alpina]